MLCLIFGHMKTIKCTNKNIRAVVKREINKLGNNANLNHIDVSAVTDMSLLFAKSDFVGNVDQWDVGNVESMEAMFAGSKFNGDVSHWNVGGVINMREMFFDSLFDGDVSRWNVSKVQNFALMFAKSRFNGDVSNWNVSSAKNLTAMFMSCDFDKNIEQWALPSNIKRELIFGEKIVVEEEQVVSSFIQRFKNIKELLKPSKNIRQSEAMKSYQWHSNYSSETIN